MKIEYKNLLNGFKQEAVDDTIGLYQIICHLEDDFNVQKNDLQQAVLSFVKEMILEGFKAGSASGKALWENQDMDYIVSRIETEWSALGRTPKMGEIVYFSLSK